VTRIVTVTYCVGQQSNCGGVIRNRVGLTYLAEASAWVVRPSREWRTCAEGLTSQDLGNASPDGRINHQTIELYDKRTYAQRSHTRLSTTAAVITTEICVNHSIGREHEALHLMQLALVAGSGAC
jgi:hypothetical protein